MTRVVVASDLHLDAGGSLGSPDQSWGSTRLLDAQRALAKLSSEECEVLLIGGDLFAGPSPAPEAIAVLQEALAASPAKRIVLVHGNHDASGKARSILHVVAGNDPRCSVHEQPELVDCGPVQIGVLPWTPPQRLYEPGLEKADAHRAAADALLDIARGLAAQLDEDRPSLIFAHWLLAGTILPNGNDVLSAAEPLIPAVELEASGSWNVCLAGHNHKRQQTADKTWITGPLMRGGFGEADLDVGYVVLDLDGRAAVEPEFIDSGDRQLVTVKLDPDRAIRGEVDIPDVDGAVVRLVGACTPDQARQIHDRAGDLVDACLLAGAVKVDGPKLDVERTRASRSDLTVETDPLIALDEWLATQDLDDELRDRARQLGAQIIAGQADPLEELVA